MKATENVLRLTTPVPPSANNAYANDSRGGRRLTSRARDYKYEVGWKAVEAGCRHLAIEPPYVLTVAVYFADKRRRDLSNCCKLIEDTLMEVIHSDDRHVGELHMYLYLDVDNPRAEVTLKGLEDSAL